MAFNLGTSGNSGKLHMSGLLSSSENTNTEKEIPIEQLVPWENQPFKMYSEFKLHELAESIKENGLLSRIIVYPISDGKYRIIAGHNRVEACRLAGINNIPSIVKNGIDENRAKLIMADTNLCQRTELLPSERAYAYKAQQEALVALGSPRSTAEIADKYGENRKTIQRYISCSRLTPKLMDMLDEGRITLNTAVTFSGMPDSSQKEIAAYLNNNPDKGINAEIAKNIYNQRFITEGDIQELIEKASDKHAAPKTQSVKKSEPDTTDEEDDEEESLPERDLKKQTPPRADPNPAATPREITKKENVSDKNPAADITLNYNEVAEIIGDELSPDQISEYLFFCLQRSDFVDEWKALYADMDQDEENSL